MQYVILLDDRVVDILDRSQYENLGIEVNEQGTIVTEGEFEDCELYEDEEHKFQQGSIQGKTFILLHRDYRAETELWKKEWLKSSPPREVVHHLTNPAGSTKDRHGDWDSYLIPRSKQWWKERGWKIIWGSPKEGCRFEKLPH